jgi:hypothetical protein
MFTSLFVYKTAKGNKFPVEYYFAAVFIDILLIIGAVNILSLIFHV